MRELSFQVGHLVVTATQKGNSFGDQEISIAIFDDDTLTVEIVDSFNEGEWIEFSESGIKQVLEHYRPRLF